MAIVELHIKVRRFLPIVALVGLLQTSSVDAQIKLSPGRVPIGDNELNSPIAEPQVTIDEHSSNAVMRPVPLVIQQAKDPLVKLVYETREAQRRRLLSTAEHTPWQIMHGMLALREEFLIRHNGKPVSCLEWIKTGPTFENENWFEKTQVRVLTGRGGNNAFEMMMVGRGHPYNKPYAFEGHINQFVAILSMSGVPLETQFNTPQGPVSMRDMLTYAKMTVNAKEEVTWTLWALSRYLPPDAEWTNALGEKWSIERLVKIETAKSLQGAPCGGTHGLFALAHARNVYLRSGKPLVGVWLEAEQKIRRYIQTARMQQNSNGTLSSNYFRGREYKQDFDKRMASSGHLLEFLMMALPSQELNAPWVRRAIEATSNDLMVNRKAEVSCSPLYHATSALSIYLDRITAVAVPANIAQGAPKTHTISNSKELKTADAELTRPVVDQPEVDQPETVKAEDVNPEAVKTPVMESSGVDSNGAPKALTGPATAVPDVPAKTELGPLPTPGEPTPESKPASEPVPSEPVPSEPIPGEPVPSEPVPAKVEAGGADPDVEPAEKASPKETTPESADGVTEPDLKVEPVVLSPTDVPAAPVATAADAGLPEVAPSAIPAQSSDKTAAATPAPADKIRVFCPRPAPATHIVPKLNPPADKIRVDASQAVPDVNLATETQIVATRNAALGMPATDPHVPSSPVPPVPLPCELLFTLPDDELVPTPVADPSSEQPVPVIPSTPLVVSTNTPPLTAKIKKENPDLLPLKSPTLPLRSVSRFDILTNDKDHPPTEQPKDKKAVRWKATLLERRKVFVVEEKTPGK